VEVQVAKIRTPRNSILPSIASGRRPRRTGSSASPRALSSLKTRRIAVVKLLIQVVASPRVFSGV